MDFHRETAAAAPLLEIAHRRNFLMSADHKVFIGNLEEISRMISGIINGLENREI